MRECDDSPYAFYQDYQRSRKPVLDLCCDLLQHLQGVLLQLYVPVENILEFFCFYLPGVHYLLS